MQDGERPLRGTAGDGRFWPEAGSLPASTLVGQLNATPSPTGRTPGTLPGRRGVLIGPLRDANAGR